MLTSKVSSPPPFAPFLWLRGMSLDNHYSNYWKAQWDKAMPWPWVRCRGSNFPTPLTDICGPDQVCYSATLGEAFVKQMGCDNSNLSSPSWLHLITICREPLVLLLNHRWLQMDEVFMMSFMLNASSFWFHQKQLATIQQDHCKYRMSRDYLIQNSIWRQDRVFSDYHW